MSFTLTVYFSLATVHICARAHMCTAAGPTEAGALATVHICAHAKKRPFRGRMKKKIVYLSFMPKHHRKQKITKFGQFFYVAAFNGLRPLVP